MLRGDVNRQPIQLLVNYWEIPPTQIGARLDEFLRQGVTHLVSFIPWQSFESDITHSLTRFLQALSERKMTVAFIVTPEVGVHYPFSGIPKDLFSKPENTARHFQNGVIAALLPPHVFNLPSLISPEFLKRYYGFLAKLDGFFSALHKSEPQVLTGVTTILTGSFWKYYRSAKDSITHPFGGVAGDYSGFSGVGFRQFLELFYSQKEFQEPNSSVANRWKSHLIEGLNRRIFYQHSEDVFRNRSTQFLRRKSLPVQCLQFELFTPEADPSLSYYSFLHHLTGTKADFSRFSGVLDVLATRAGGGIEDAVLPFVHWSGLGPFSSLSDSERQFLFLKSLILFGSRGGGVLIDAEEWFSLSQTFRTRAESLGRQLASGGLRLVNRALFLTPHLWSDGGNLWEELNRLSAPEAIAVSSIDSIVQEQEAKFAIVDPSFVLTREVVSKLVHWARRGRVVALPRSPFYTEAARLEVEQMLGRRDFMEIKVGLSYRLQTEGDGKILLYDLPSSQVSGAESSSLWGAFLKSTLSIAGITPVCSLTDERLKTISLDFQNPRKRCIFVFNGEIRPVSASVIFSEPVCVTDFFSSQQSSVAPALRFSLDVPPFGVLPLKTEEQVPRAATAVLPEEHLSPWN